MKNQYIYDPQSILSISFESEDLNNPNGEWWLCVNFVHKNDWGQIMILNGDFSAYCKGNPRRITPSGRSLIATAIKKFLQEVKNG